MTLNRISLAALVLLVSVASCKKDNDYVENKVPVAEAGSPKNITLPDTAVVTGSGTDADGKVVAYLWSQVSGPTSSVISNPGATTTGIKFSAAGTYLFQLMVTDDKGATGVDTVSVVVNPAAAKTLTLQPANNPNEFNFTLEASTNYSAITSLDIPVETWSRNGNFFVVRPVVKFDLSSIPANATIVSANLYLYSYPNPTYNGNLSDANFGSSNAMYVQQITQNWSPNTATWANQPSTTTTNQVSVAQANTTTLDLNLDVTAMTANMVANNANYGYMLKLQNEIQYNSRIFIASHNTNSGWASKFPKLVVVYK